MKDLARLLKYVRPYWGIFVFALLAMLLGAVFETATGALLVPIFNQFLGEPSVKSKTLFDLNSLIPRDDWYRAWIAISALLLTFTVLKGIAEYFSSYLMAKIGQSAILKLRGELYEHLLKQSATFFEKHRTNFLVSRLVVSCAAIELAVSSNLRDVLREAFMLVFFVTAAFYYNWRLTLGSLIIAPIIGFVTSNYSRRLRKLADVSLEGNKALSDTSQEALSNHVIVKAYNGEPREKRRFLDVAGLIARANMRAAGISATAPPTLEMVGIIAICTLFYFGLREINSHALDASQFFAFLFFLFRSYDPMRKISRQHNEISKAFAAARDVWGILDENETLPEKADAVDLNPLRNEIRIDNLSFNYRNNRRKILENIDLTVKKGEMVALVGQSGGGKSSLTRLVQRLYDPSSGTITWDGTDLRDASILTLRRQIALVTQETVLFNDTVRNNIAYGRPDASDADIREAARIAFAADFIEQLPNGYDTLVGERGTLLSGGQRQRVAIARAVLLNAPVLILDEATSALDTESESLVQKAIGNLMQNRTSIVIAHRLSTIRMADLIVVMEKGRIVETGTHDDLLAHAGVYKRLYEMQFASEDLVQGVTV
ncbi:MAG TPA: ABC transporter transmembrane domain-containing protein [Pyrinomonadaceae bacterium]|jgi:subfamily B ATP-binding cassette protein MsbA|nr:ABC transporter transmembrane domain-containing protein [Pyrinomonadaceae bacterium]